MIGEAFGRLPHEILELGIHEFALAWKCSDLIWSARAAVNEASEEG